MLTSALTKEGTNIDFEVTERSTDSSDKKTAPVYPTQSKNKTQNSSSKIIPIVLDTTKNNTRVTKVVAIMDMSKISYIDKLLHPRIKKRQLKLSELPVNTGFNNRNISTSNVPNRKIRRFAGKVFESMNINDKVETRANRNRNGKENVVGNISQKVIQQNPNSKCYPLRST